MTSIILYIVFLALKPEGLNWDTWKQLSGSSFRLYSNRIKRQDKDSGKHGKVSGVKA